MRVLAIDASPHGADEAVDDIGRPGHPNQQEQLTCKAVSCEPTSPSK
jgi:hypothetical protein